MKNSRVGVVIQGPILSVGRNLRDKTPVPYDASEDVNKTLDQCADLGWEAVVSTWTGESLDGVRREHRMNVSQISFPRSSIGHRLRNNWNGNPKYKQFYSTFAGVKALERRGCDFILKTRTDVVLDLLQLRNYVEGLTLDECQQYLFVPVINLDKPHMLYDFYAFGSLENIKRFSSMMTFGKEICANVHHDAFYRWAWQRQSSGEQRAPLRKIHPNFPMFSGEQLAFCELALEKVYSPLPQALWTSQTWRGQEFGTESLKSGVYLFAETPREARMERFREYPYSKIAKGSVDIYTLPSLFMSSKVEAFLRHPKRGTLAHRLAQSRRLRPAADVVRALKSNRV